MKSSLLTIAFSLLVFVSIAQPGWNWPEDEALQAKAKEKQAFYKVQMQLNDQDSTFQTLQWLYKNNPNLNASIYIDGAKVLENVLKVEKDPARRVRLQDSVLWMFDQRIAYFGDEAKVTDRKAYAAFKMHYRTKSRYPLLKELYEKNFELNGNNVSGFNLIPYMTLAKFYYETDPEAMTGEMVLEVHGKVSDAIAHKIANGGNKTKLQKDQDKADAFLSSLEGLLSCDFIEGKLVPKMRANPEDLNLAKKVFTYSLRAKCSDEPYFIEAGDAVYADDPNFQLAKALGDKSFGKADYEKALSYYEKAEELASSPEEKYEALISQATTYSKLGNKPKARAHAYEASSQQPSAVKPFNLIGNLYFTSFNSCKGGESKVLDRAIFIAAYNMYKKAGNQAQMAASKEQFPSIEDIFNENYAEGQEVNIGCWVNTTVALMRRD